MGGLELGRWDVAEAGVQPAGVVPVDPGHRGVLDIADGLQRALHEGARADALGLVEADDRLHEAVVVGVPDRTDRRRHPLQGQMLDEAQRRVLGPGVVVMDQPVRQHQALTGPVPPAHSQAGEHQIRRAGRGRVPGHDALSEDIDDKGDVDEPGPRAHVREVGDPHGVRGRGGEVAVEQIRRPRPILGRDRGAHPPASDHPGQPERAHQPVHRAVGHRQPTPAQVGGHLPPAVEALRGAHGGQQRIHHHRVADRARGRLPTGLLPGAVGSRGDRHALLAQDRADRLDRVAFGPHLIDEPGDQRLRGSSSPAKKIEALRRISLASRNRLFSALSRLISSASAVVTPSRSPESISA